MSSEWKDLKNFIFSLSHFVIIAKPVPKLHIIFQVETSLGPIHTVLYNAGTFIFKNWENVTVEEFEFSFNVNAKVKCLVCSVTTLQSKKYAGNAQVTNVTISYDKIK